jgi:hypothetical protein
MTLLNKQNKESVFIKQALPYINNKIFDSYINRFYSFKTIYILLHNMQNNTT